MDFSTTKNIILFNKYMINFDKKDWDFLCKNRWFTDNPDGISYILTLEYPIY